MHRPSTARLAMLGAAFGSLMAAAKNASAEINQAAEEFNLEDFQSALHAKGYPVHAHQKSHTAFLNQESRRPSESYKARQKMRRRYDNGLTVPPEVEAAYKRHDAERADIGRRRAKYHQHPSVLVRA